MRLLPTTTTTVFDPFRMVRRSQRIYEAILRRCPLVRVPAEVLDRICSELDSKDCRSLALTCRALHQLASYRSLTISSGRQWLPLMGLVAARPELADRIVSLEIGAVWGALGVHPGTTLPIQGSTLADIPTEPLFARLRELEYHESFARPKAGAKGLFALLSRCPNVNTLLVEGVSFGHDLGPLPSPRPSIKHLRLAHDGPALFYVDALLGLATSLRHLEIKLGRGRHLYEPAFTSVGKSCPHLETLHFDYDGIAELDPEDHGDWPPPPPPVGDIVLPALPPDHLRPMLNLREIDIDACVELPMVLLQASLPKMERFHLRLLLYVDKEGRSLPYWADPDRQMRRFALLFKRGARRWPTLKSMRIETSTDLREAVRPVRDWALREGVSFSYALKCGWAKGSAIFEDGVEHELPTAGAGP